MAVTASWTVEQADVLEWLDAYEGPRYQSVLCDPPYALISIAERFGSEDAAPAQHGTDGVFARVSGGFMGMRWDGGTDFHDLPSPSSSCSRSQRASLAALLIFSARRLMERPLRNVASRWT